MKLAILDRDGTLNALGDDSYIGDPEDWNALPGALEAVARLNHAGWRVVVATNQPGLIDAVFYCPHAPDQNCNCRKPAPGLLEQICERYGVEPRDVQVVGSCTAHLLAGAALGAQLHLVCTGHSVQLNPQATLGEEWPAGVQVHATLAAFAEHLLAASVPPPPVSPAATAASAV